MVESLKIAIDGSLFISANCELVGTTWNRIDITKTAEVLMIDINGKLKRFRASAGENPITSWDLLNGVVVSDTSGNLPDITQITTRNHNDLQNRDAADAHPEAAVTNLTTDLAAKVAKSGDTMTGKLTVRAKFKSYKDPDIPSRNYIIGQGWTSRSASEATGWDVVIWSPELGLFVAVGEGGTNQVMTSPDGINWTSQSASEVSGWTSVTWSPELGLFVAVAYSGTNRVMTSPDGINWTIQSASENSQWTSVTWSPELGLFVAVADFGTNRVMNSASTKLLPQNVREATIVPSSNTGLGVLRVARAKYDFAVDGGAIGLITPALNAAIPDNAVIIGGTINSTTAVTSGGAATISIGTSAGSSAASLLGVTAVASFSLDARINSIATFAAPVKTTAAGSITLTVADFDLTAGVIEVTVLYYVAAA